MTSDKFIYLFGRIIPGLSLILSMVLRFVPRYTAQIKVISNAQKCVGRDVTQGNVIAKARNGIKILSIMTTWALENAIETADSMRARGYGLPKRTSFSIFRFDNRDKVTFAVMAGLIVIVLIGAVTGENTMRFPSIKTINITIFSLVIYTAILYYAYCLSLSILWRKSNGSI